jgi:hypothetical protein
MASRNVRPIPHSESSGRAFNSKLTNVAASAGLRKPVVYGAIGGNDYIVESMGCGVAFIDFDNDGWLDVLLLSGRRLSDTPPGAELRLYKNNRDGAFTEVTEHAGIGRSVWATGVTVGDYDNDGFEDIFIACWGQNILFHNNGDGTFTDVTERAGLLHEGVRYATGCTWIDFDRDGRIDLFVAHYMAFDTKSMHRKGEDRGCSYRGVPVFCGPNGGAPEPCRLYRNNGDGTFTDISEKSGVLAISPGHPLTAVTADFDGDGWPDLYVACDTSPSLLLRNNHDGTFREQGLESGVSLSEDGEVQAGMGLGVGDFDCDGRIDLLKTHFSNDTSGLYRNLGGGNFRDVTLRAGLGVETRYVGWGAGIVDLDNDGLPDLFICTGMAYPEVEARLPEVPYRTPCVLFRNLDGGRFEELGAEAGPAMSEAHAGRGMAFGDFDNDGDIDVLIMNMNEPPSLLRNDVSGGGHWLKVLLKGTASNRSAIGALVTVSYGERKQAQSMLAQSSYLSASDRRLHFGLGSAEKASLEVRWPNGAAEKIDDVPVDRLLIVQEGKGVVSSEPMRGPIRR